MISVPPIINIIDDDTSIVQYIQDVLNRHDYVVKTATSGVDGLNLVVHTDPNLILLDMQLSDVEGESICREIRQAQPDTPLILLSSDSSVQETVKGFNLGADDYIVKPFATEELMARIRARLRQNSQDESDILRIADLELDPKRVVVSRAGKSITLTPNEFKLLQYLMTNPGIVLTREMILNRIWTYVPDVETRVVDVYMGYLRRKIDKGNRKKLLHSIRGFGYTLRE